MHWQVSGREQISHCNIKISTYSYIFLSELKRDEKAEGKETWLSISNSQWNTNSHEAIFCIKQGNIQGESC